MGDRVQRLVEELCNLAGAEGPHDQTLEHPRRSLRGRQPDEGRIVGGHELNREDRFGGEFWRRLAVQPLRLVAPGEAGRRIVGNNLLVDLGALASPVPIKALPASQAGTFDQLHTICEGEPLRHSGGIVHQRPYLSGGRGDQLFANDTSHPRSIIVRVTNMSSAEQFESSYRKLWAALHRPDDPDLSQHEREILQHVPAKGGCSLTEIVAHLGLPKSSCSEIVKGLTRRGFLNRVRDPSDDRRLQLTLTRQGTAKVANDSVLNLGRLAAALGRLRPADQKELVRLMAELAALSAPSAVKN